MITKERLEELIEQGATIYDKYANALMLFNFEQKDDVGFYSQKTHIKNGHLVFEHIGDYDYHFEYCLEDLFETKEDAEEYAEFGNITRTERLELPSWEDVNHKERIFVYKFHIKDNFDGFGKLMIIKDSSIMVQCSSLGVLHQEYFDKPFTKENYDKARRLCVKLFKGEEV